MENYSVEYTAQKLKELCQRAGKYIIGVEPMPYSGIPDLQKGWEVVKASGCENAMLIMDTWHWVRANQPYDHSDTKTSLRKLFLSRSTMYGETIRRFNLKR